jgi:purine-binding chemotaxis protein CheW
MADHADPAGEPTRRILEERARALAGALVAEEPADTVELVVLTVGSERYGAEADRVREIRFLAELTPVPGTPPLWAGIVNVRGTLYPVLDLRRCFGLPHPGADAGDQAKKVALVSAAGLTVGLMVEDASEVRSVAADAIGPPLEGASAAVTATVRGVTDDLLAILDVEALLADPRLVVKEVPT